MGRALLDGGRDPDSQALGSPWTLDVPLALEGLKIAERAGNGLVGKVRLVLLEQAAARLGVVGFGYGILQIALLDCIQGDDYAVDLGQRVVQVAFGARRRELDLLDQAIRSIHVKQAATVAGGLPRRG